MCPDLNLVTKYAKDAGSFRSETMNAWREQSGNGWNFASLTVIDTARSKTNPTGMSGGKLVRCFHMRSDILPTRALLFRKKQYPSEACRHCGAPKETITHLLGACRSHIAKTQCINRHDRVVKQICRMAENQKLVVNKEKALFGREGQRARPDAIISGEEITFIVEVGITTETLDHTALKRRYIEKRKKYECQWIKDSMLEAGLVPQGNRIILVPIIIGARGSYLKSIPAEVQMLAHSLKVSSRKLLSCVAQTTAEMSLLTLDKLLR